MPLHPYDALMATATTSKSQRLTEFTTGVGGNVDTENHVIRNVKILGASSKNGRTYTEHAMRQAIALYEGAKVNLNHPKGKPDQPRDYQDRIGHLSNIAFRESALFGDFHYNPKHPIAGQLIHDAQHSPASGGFSHNVQAQTSKSGGKLVVEAITRVTSVDLVADPATTNGLYEHVEEPEMSLAEMTLEQILAARPDLKAAVLTEAQQSQESQDQAAELKRLREQVDAFEAKEKLAARKAVVDAKIAEAKLPEATLSAVFLESCYEATDEKLAKLIEDRASLAKQMLVQKPKSSEQNVVESVLPQIADAKSFAAFLRS